MHGNLDRKLQQRNLQRSYYTQQHRVQRGKQSRSTGYQPLCARLRIWPRNMGSRV